MRASELTDEQLEDCVDGNTSIDMLREIVEKTELSDGLIDEEAFADWFAYGIEGFIAAEPETEEWDESNEANWDWGYDIACNINATIQPVEE